MFSIPVRIALGALATVILAVAVMFVLQLGPFNHRPSAAAKELPKVAAKVADTQKAVAVDVGKAEVKTVAKADDTKKRTENHVAKIRAAPDGGSDAEFFGSVCDTQLYQGSADCSRYRR
ncbi:hypothetical protein UFOVP1324_54 [uncultured Caudovirales phage]|uniref:Uncharacterized protein n=1 Tax=uncultured Caudovirales phage TaxID=2100421 RepID=A0A6J5RWW7_9CAUD|nr:hypothetical protein UFOVP1324_54 [uncultured Caudovirales phage]